jgi:hypothetical protein
MQTSIRDHLRIIAMFHPDSFDPPAMLFIANGFGPPRTLRVLKLRVAKINRRWTKNRNPANIGRQLPHPIRNNLHIPLARLFEDKA